MIVEEDSATANALQRKLESAGVEVRWVENYEAAVELLDKERFHAIITDTSRSIDMIKMAEKRGIPTIVVTTKGNYDLAKEAINHGAYHLLEKPAELDLIVPVLKDIWEDPKFLSALMERFIDLHHLTEKEREIAHLVLKGLSNKEIAAVMGNTEKTIKFHMTTIFEKCGVQSRTEFFNSIFPT